MYKVILMNGGGEQGKWILRQTHNHKGISSCGKYQFYVNEIIPDPDFVIVRGKSIKKESKLGAGWASGGRGWRKMGHVC